MAASDVVVFKTDSLKNQNESEGYIRNPNKSLFSCVVDIKIANRLIALGYTKPIVFVSTSTASVYVVEIMRRIVICCMLANC